MQEKINGVNIRFVDWHHVEMSQSRILYTPVQEKRKPRIPSRRSVLAVLTIFGIIIVTGGVLYALQAPYFQISSIKISGLTSLHEDDIREKISSFLDERIAMFFSQRSFFFVRPRNAESVLKDAFPKIASVVAVKIFPKGLAIEISERKLWGIYCNDFKIEMPTKDGTAEKEILPLEKETSAMTCAYVDNTGFAYESAPSSSGSLLIKIHGDGETKIPSQVIPEELSRQMAEFGVVLKGVLGIDAIGYEFSLQISREFRVKTSEGFFLWINRDDDFAGVVKVLKTVLDEEIKDRRNKLEYADLRFGNKVFYKFKK